MPRAAIAAPQFWRADFVRERAGRDQARERWIQGWAMVTLIACVLYILIGHNPYQHEVQLDLETGGATISPVNRYAWLGLTLMSAPLLWWRRARVAEAVRRQWLTLALFGWFAVTTVWALDPGSADRRLFLYVLNLACAVAFSVGFGDSRRLHRALAFACAGMIAIDLLSWVLAPKLSMTELGLAAIHSQKNQLGAAMLFCGLVIGPYVFTQRRLTGRLAWSGAFVAGFVLLVASESKTSLAIMISAMVLTPALLYLLKRPLAVSYGLLALVTLALATCVMGWLAWCTITGADPLGPLSGVTFTQRTDVWGFVVGEIAKRPFTGAGFGSFWDIDPAVQPSLQGDLWFGSAALANEAHNGYLDLLATTGVLGLAAALVLLFRWLARALTLLRRSLLDPGEEGRPLWPAATVLVLFPLLLFVHNFMESSYFTANQIFGSLALVIGAEIDMRYRRRG